MFVPEMSLSSTSSHSGRLSSRLRAKSRLRSLSISSLLLGAAAQRSDPKSGDPGQWAQGLGPQGDEIRILNYVRSVRDADK